MSNHPMSKRVQDAEGNWHASYAAAARALNVHVNTIADHMKRYGDLSMIGCWAVKVRKGKREWPSIVAASRDLKITDGQVRNHLRKHGHLEFVGKHGGKRWTTPLKIGPIEWPSRVDAAKDLKVAPVTLRVWLSPTASATQREEMMARVMALHSKRQKKSTRQMEEAF